MLIRLLMSVLVVIGLALSGLWYMAGISPAQLPSAGALATGLAAKLTCSGQHLSGFDARRNADDLAVYSELTRLVSYRALPEGGVAATFLGGSESVARYRPGLGCTLANKGQGQLAPLQLPPTAADASRPWPAGSAAAAFETSLQATLLGLLAADNVAGHDTRALLVMRDGQILGEAYAHGIDAGTPLLGWSMGKSVTAILLGRLEALGKLTVAERNLFPAWAGDKRRDISVEAMLQMSSGLEFMEDYIPGSDSTRMLFMSPSASDIAMASLPAHAPGTHFAYSSGTTNLLARLLFERVGGTAQAQMDYITREISLPLALQATTFELDASGVFVGSSFIYAPARDWARFGYLMINDGTINGHQLLERDWIARATRPNTSTNEPRYGYQFWLNDGGSDLRWPSLPRSAYAMQGNREQVVMMLPSLETVIVRLGWSLEEYPVDDVFARIIRELD